MLAGLTMEREALYARIDARVEAMLAAGVAEEVRRAHAAGASETARKALGFEELLSGDVEAMKRRTRNYAKRQLTWMRKLAGVRVIDVTGRDPAVWPWEILDSSRLMRFEKWQALGNDYLIVERDELPFALTPARVRRLCEGHFGVFADGVLELSRPEDHANVADLRIFNPDGSEAELSGNGAREAILYLRRRGWTEPRTSSRSRPSPGRSARRSRGRTRAAWIWAARASPPRTSPADRPTVAGSCSVDNPELATLSFQHVSIGNPQCAIHVDERGRARGARSRRSWVRRSKAHSQFPEPHERLVVHRDRDASPTRIRRARIFERGVGETLSSGTGATGAAVAYVLSRGGAGGEGTHITVVLDGGELEVEVGEDLRVDLTGWARPVFDGRLSDDFVKELHETE